MPFELEVTADFESDYKRLIGKNADFRAAFEKKVAQILENPFRFKPLRAPLFGFRRVHLMKSFVLLYSIDEKRKVVLLASFEHHDRAFG